jgi:hypothetical protein
MIPQMDDGVDPTIAQLLQDGLDRLNAESPPQHVAPNFLANFRHLCTKARQAQAKGTGVSTAITLKERYVTGWERTDSGRVLARTDYVSVPTHAILYREGRCAKCGDVARSDVGRVVLTAQRPPVEGRVARA